MPGVFGGGQRSVIPETSLDKVFSPKVTIPTLTIALLVSIGFQHRSRRKRVLSQQTNRGVEVDADVLVSKIINRNEFSVTINNISMDVQTIVADAQWSIYANASGEYKLTPFELQNSSVGTLEAIVRLSVGKSDALWAHATEGTEFLNRVGSAAMNSNNKLLIVERSRNVACVLQNSCLNLSTRLEINYDDGKVQGSKG